ncbi:phospholipase D-like domain-containing protein [Ferruginibacter sp. HRS2-29]|uniref:phospholipase D-like domain-containing protein n=1 Tax=Ferruginibacter sp. HRS2-29 TaxID=2487334 RepID=UPI0020CF9A5C|nr:phospholipase D-like domain-containing protein [Ferruginibacter sp. HRS2-29]
MRTRTTENGITINAVVGTSAVLLSFDIEKAATKELLGFYIRKENISSGEAYDVTSIKYFKEMVPEPEKYARYNTKFHPWQSFLWEDFSIEDKKEYKYIVTPVFGKPTSLLYGKPATLSIKIPAREKGEHEVHFNRGVAGSQAYAKEFGNQRPDAMPAVQQKKALKWLSKGLKEAMLDFIATAKDERWKLRCCFYEFIFPEVLQALKRAAENGADVKIIYDSRSEKDKNDKAIKANKVPRKLLIRREADPDFLQHNKFMVLINNDQPQHNRVWFGSTNITEKAIYGHCNVGHILRNKDVAANYLRYWEALKKDPVAAIMKKETVAIQEDITELQNGMTQFFSPRPTTKALKLYAGLVGASSQLVCGMFPFSFYAGLKEAIKAETEHLKYIIIDKKTKNTLLESNDYDNVIVYAGVLEDELYGWAAETDSGELFYSGVNFIHNKVILIDPLSEVPIVITGSANFSNNSISNNDENTVIIKGNKHVADLYFTEFARIFNHYSTRQDTKKLTKANEANNYNPAHLDKTNKWTRSFFNPNGLKCKRRLMFSDMQVEETN